jgi:hypothetical protein
MFRISAVNFAKKAAVRKEAAVSPYSVFLMHQAATLPKSSKITTKPASNNVDLDGVSFEVRGKQCGKIWKSSSATYRKQCAEVASAMPNHTVKKPSALGIARRPPPFARWIKANWHIAPATLSFEARTLYLARIFHRTWKKSHFTAAKQSVMKSSCTLNEIEQQRTILLCCKLKPRTETVFKKQVFFVSQFVTLYPSNTKCFRFSGREKPHGFSKTVYLIFLL